MAFATFSQSAYASIELKSPIPATKEIVNWGVDGSGWTLVASSPLGACGLYALNNKTAIPGWPWVFEEIKAGPADASGLVTGYGCYFKELKADGTFGPSTLLVGVEGNPEWACTSPYKIAGTQCFLPPEKDKKCPCVGNPINFSTGNKHQVESDLPPLTGELEFYRTYNSEFPSPNLRNSSVVVATPGYGWQHNFHRSIVLQKAAQVATISRRDGSVYAFTLSNGVWTGDADDNARLQQLTDANGKLTGWVYNSPMNYIETYDAKGRLISEKSRAGVLQTLTYDDTTNLLVRVVDSFGRQLQFAYDLQARLKQLTTPDNKTYTYAYDTNGNLASVTYPDTKIRSYVYENASFPHALTGIIDENGARFVTWKYDAQGRAISSEHAVGIDKYTIDYSHGQYAKYVTDPLGAMRSYSFTPVLDDFKINYIGQPAGYGSGPATSSITYDGNGNKKTESDFKGNATAYTYNLARNLETKRVVASGTAQEQTVSTIWHPTLNIPTQVNEPLLRTTYIHDANGNILTKTLQATTDADGSQGASATPVGSPRTWTYTYNSAGQVLTITNPRTDVLNKTTYTYDTQGNLVSVSNGAGHVTTLTNHDGNGKPGQITDPNGAITVLTYTERGWLKQRVVTADGISETTIYDYDGVGQMTKVTLPDSSYISYTYDDAHRLTKISDSQGNSINYTLDNIGNRINETITDGGGNLKLQVTRIYDALNRLQQVTGAAQ
ncbi:MAG: RHS repeat protein [Burkholderiales bacterium]|nr:RHS repeat protein [Burkholderiales bacterium]